MNFSLTDYIEIVRVEDLYKPGNKFEMIRTPEEPTRIKDIVGRYKITSDKYNAYIAENNFHLTSIAFTDIFQRNTILFFVNTKINVDNDILQQRLRTIWQTKAGVSQQGNESQEKIFNEFPIQMPSRNKIFR